MRKNCHCTIVQAPHKQSPTSASKAWGGIDAFHKNGITLTYKFLDKNTKYEESCLQVMKEIEGFCNIKFARSNVSPAVRITFDPRLGSWSYIGSDIFHISPTDPTMNLGWLSMSTTRHEFGHTLGLGHEHQNPKEGIKWNKEKVIKDLSGPPNNWSKGQIEWNMFRVFAESQIKGTAFDPLSIMIYPIPASWTSNGFSVAFTETWSQKDIAFLAEQYPFTEPKPISDDLSALKRWIEGTHRPNFIRPTMPQIKAAWKAVTGAELQGKTWTTIAAEVAQWAKS
jgi:Astacin (Peptidase family M12A)